MAVTDLPSKRGAASRPAAPVPNLIERAIATFAPEWALRRHKARAATAMTGGYAGAGYSERMAYWQPGVLDADGDITRDLRELRARSRDLVRNSPIASGAIETQVTHVVGSGLTLQSRIDAECLGLDDDQAAEWQCETERRWRLWSESTYCDANDKLTFAELQDLAYRTRCESGDGFVVLASMTRPGWPYTLALQLVEADRVCNPGFAADKPTLVQGIERNEMGAPVAAHIADQHPGRTISASTIKWQRVAFRGKTGRRNLLHLMRMLRPGQTRGLPELAPIIGTLKQLARYSDAEIDAAVNSAAMAVFVKMDPDSFTELFDDDDQATIIDSAKRWDGTLRSGAAVNLLPGESIDAPQLGRPNPNFDPFVSAFMTQVGMGLNIPREVLTKHFQASYSAARAALLDAWRTFSVRRAAHARSMCQPIYEEWLADEVAAGRISAPGFFADALTRKAWCGSSWSGDGPGALDPLKEVKAASERMKEGITTLSEEIVAYDGGDWETKHRQRAREVSERREAQLEPPLAMPAAPNGAPGQAVPGMPAPGEDTTEDPTEGPTAAPAEGDGGDMGDGEGATPD